MLLTLLAVLNNPAIAVEPSPDDSAALEFRATLERMSAAVDGLRDLTMTFYQREWVKGEMTAEKKIMVKWRRPEHLVLEYIGDPYPDRIVVWRGPQTDNGKLRVDPGRFLPALSLAYDGSLAMRGQRHNIRDLPVTKLAQRIIDGALKVNDHPTWQPEVEDLGVSTVRGETTRCFNTSTPKDEDPTLYAYKVKLCVNPATHLPNSVRVYDLEDGEVRLVEEYDYVQVKTNVGLTDADFEWDTYGL